MSDNTSLEGEIAINDFQPFALPNKVVEVSNDERSTKAPPRCSRAPEPI